MKSQSSSNKLSPSPLKDNINRRHQENIRERSRDTHSENQLSPPNIHSQQPTFSNQKGPDSAPRLPPSETAKTKNPSERNMIDEYRQKLKSKHAESKNLSQNSYLRQKNPQPSGS